MDTYPVDVVYFLVDVIENLKADNEELTQKIAELTTSEEDKQEEIPEEKALTRIADTLPRYCGRVDRSEVENAMDALDYAEAEENNEMREGWRQHLLNEMAMLRSENPDSNVEIDAIVELLQQLAA